MNNTMSIVKNNSSTVIKIIIFLIILYYPFSLFLHAKSLESFCNDMPSDSKKIDKEYIKLLAEERNFSVFISQNSEHIMIYDNRTMGKYTCHIDYSEERVKVSYFLD